jgi:hypothetical protein
MLTLQFECMYPLINFITNNKELFQTTADVHSANTRHKRYLHKPTANLHAFRKGHIMLKRKTKLRGRSPQANYTDRATAACRRS